MFEFIATFIFKGTRAHSLSDALVYDLRREVSRMFEKAGFGDSIENQQKCFDNPYAVPAIDEFLTNTDELHISYMWLYPLNIPGNLITLQSACVPELHSYAKNYDIEFIFRTHLI